MRQLQRIVPLAVSFLLFWSIATVSVSLSGCSSWRSTSYKTTGTVVITADTAMKAWAMHVAKGLAKPEQEITVRAAYGKYQAAMLAVIDAGKAATAADDQSALQRVVAAAAAAQADLAGIIQAFVPQQIVGP
jgi:uncharacterized protein YceK